MYLNNLRTQFAALPVKNAHSGDISTL